VIKLSLAKSYIPDELVSLLDELYSKDDLFDSNYLVSAILSARICHSKLYPVQLIEDDVYFNSNEKARLFLQKLYNLNHFSVFAHVISKPITFNLKNNKEYINFLLLSSIYKTYFYIDKQSNIGYIRLNLRHILEYEYFYKNIKDNSKYLEKLFNNFDINIAKNKYIVKTGKCINFNISCNVEDKHQVLKIEDKYSVPVKDLKFATIFVSDMSRCSTRQLLRHNFTFIERSQRYVKLDKNADYIVPPSLDDCSVDIHRMFADVIDEAIDVYNKLVVNFDIPKEDARYVLPNAICTVIGITFTYEEAKDFVEKRIIPAAQWEIRRLAKFIKEEVLRWLKILKN